MALIAEFDLAIREVDEEAEPDYFVFCGQKFGVVDETSSLPMMRLAHALYDPAITQTETMGRAYALLQHCVVPADWPRFEALAEARKAKYQDLTRIAYKIYGVRSARPTQRSSDSSDGPPTTMGNSSPDSSSPDSGQGSVVPLGRPDLAGLVSVDSLVNR